MITEKALRAMLVPSILKWNLDGSRSRGMEGVRGIQPIRGQGHSACLSFGEARKNLGHGSSASSHPHKAKAGHGLDAALPPWGHFLAITPGTFLASCNCPPFPGHHEVSPHRWPPASWVRNFGEKFSSLLTMAQLPPFTLHPEQGNWLTATPLGRVVK